MNSLPFECIENIINYLTLVDIQNIDFKNNDLERINQYKKQRANHILKKFFLKLHYHKKLIFWISTAGLLLNLIPPKIKKMGTGYTCQKCLQYKTGLLGDVKTVYGIFGTYCNKCID